MAQQSYPLGKILIESIAHLRKEKFAFVLFNFPFSPDFNLIIDDGNTDGEQFCLHSFDDKKHIKLHGKMFVNEAIEKVLELKNTSNRIEDVASDGNYMSQTDYEAYVAKIIQSIQENEMSKCVAARKKSLVLPDDFNLGEAFVEMCGRMASTFCYVANTSAGLWMGASPELLLAKKEDKYFTVALAGTKLAKDKRPWTEKERDEHRIVVDYIRKTIEENGFKVHETSPVFDSTAKHLLHLKADINFYATRSLHQELHPTPAVCGIPLNKSRAFILANEFGSRSLYAGYLGLEGEHAQYYVNLRCMQIFDKHVDVYVGAGITAESVPNDEWNETESKAQTMESLIKL